MQSNQGKATSMKSLLGKEKPEKEKMQFTTQMLVPLHNLPASKDLAKDIADGDEGSLFCAQDQKTPVFNQKV